LNLRGSAQADREERFLAPQTLLGGTNRDS
jgi:hypothetical protein